MEYNLLVSTLLNIKKYDYRHFQVAISWNPAQYSGNVQTLALSHGEHYSISNPIPIQSDTGMIKTAVALGEKKIISLKLESDYRAPSWSGIVIGSFPPMPIMECSRWMGYRYAFAIDDRLVIGRYRSRMVAPQATRLNTGKCGTTDVPYQNIPMGRRPSVILYYDKSIGRLILGDVTTCVRIVNFAI